MIVVVKNSEIVQFVTNVWSFVRFAVIVAHNCYCIPMYLFLNWILLYPLFRSAPRLYYSLETQLYHMLLYIVGSWSFTGGIVVHETGDDIHPLLRDDRRRVMFVVNHQSTADVPLLMQALTVRAGGHRLLWIMDRQFLLTNFGLVSVTHGDYFLDTKRYDSSSLREHFTRNTHLNTVILFPEGGFRYKRQESSNRFAARNALPPLLHVTYPRYGAFRDAMSAAHITHIIDTTILYESLDQPLSIVDIARGIRKSRVLFRYRVYDVLDERPSIDEQWLLNKWREKEEFMRVYYAESAESHDTGVAVPFRYTTLVAYHLFYLLFWFLLYSLITK